jgi:hypothetical protein
LESDRLGGHLVVLLKTSIELKFEMVADKNLKKNQKIMFET